MHNCLFQMLGQEIIRYPDNSGLLFNHIWGKTLRDGASNVFGVCRHLNPDVYPIRAVENYVSMAAVLGLDLSTGYLFRPTDHRGAVSNFPFASSTAESRLRLYLKEGNIDEGETLHSFRPGCAITLAMTGSSLADIMSHVGWRKAETANYYMKLAQVLRFDGLSGSLANIDPLEVASPTDQYLDLNTQAIHFCFSHYAQPLSFLITFAYSLLLMLLVTLFTYLFFYFIFEIGRRRNMSLFGFKISRCIHVFQPTFCLP